MRRARRFTTVPWQWKVVAAVAFGSVVANAVWMELTGAVRFETPFLECNWFVQYVLYTVYVWFLQDTNVLLPKSQMQRVDSMAPVSQLFLSLSFL